MDLSREASETLLKEIDEKELVNIAKSLVGHESFTGQEQGIARFLGDYARSHGVNCSLVDAAPNRPNVLLSLGGSGPFGLLLNGHFDIDPVVDGWSFDPFAGAVKDGWLYGAGVVNMKAADAAMIEALLAFKRSKMSARRPIGASLVCGELQGGFGTIKLVEAGVRAKHAVVGEPTRLSVETYHYGIRRMRVTIKGRAAHLAYADTGRDAIQAALQAIRSLSELDFAASRLESNPRTPVLNIGSIRGGISDRFEDWRPAIVPDTCVFTVDIRLPTDRDEAEVVALIQRKIEEAVPSGIEVKTELLKPPEYYPRPSFQIQQSSPIVETLVRAHERVVGTSPVVGDLGRNSLFGSDAPYLARAGIEAVVYGPGDPVLMNAPDERIQISEMVTAAKVYAVLAAELCGR